MSLPDQLVEAARKAVRDGRAASVSAYVADAMADKARRTSLGELLDELGRVHGPVSDDVMVVVDRELIPDELAVTDALREKSGRHTLADVLDQLDAELGPPGPEADAWAKSERDRGLGTGDG